MRALSLLLLLAFVSSASAQVTTSAAPQLGSSDFKASPEHPLGWRGDWTGRYPDATPPIHWGRSPKATKDLRVQTEKPAAEPAPSARPIPLGIVGQWLIAGPFQPKDPAKALDESFLPDESAAQPEPGSAAADLKWESRASRSSTITSRPRPRPADAPALPGGEILYAYTNLFSPQATKARLLLSHDPGMKIWLNGKEVYSAAKPLNGAWGAAGKNAVSIELNRGWNRLLLKGGSMSLLLAPPTPVEWTSENILWTTPMPRLSVALPVIAGDRLFLCSEPSDLLCVRKSDGKILWIRPNHFGLAFPADQRPGPFTEKVAPLIDKLQETDNQLIALLNAGNPPDAPLQKLKTDTEWKIYDELAAIDPAYKRKGPGQYEYASPTPCTDGQSVFAFYTNGIAARYDLEGKLLWATKLTNVGGAEHGQHFSPVLIAGKFIVTVNRTARALDAQTGRLLWETKAPDWITPARIGDTDVIIASRGAIVRVADGALLADLKLSNAYGWTTPIIDHGTFYDYLSRGDKAGGFFTAVELPAKPDAKSGPTKRLELTDRGLEQGWFDSSLLYHNNLVYALNATADLYVLDFPAGKTLYKQPLDMYPVVQYVVMPGCAASPALAGKYIYLMDNQGTTAIIEPGPTFKQLALNLIDNSTYGTIGDWGSALGQEQTLSTPIFEGSRIYYRAHANLYCIGEK